MIYWPANENFFLKKKQYHVSFYWSFPDTLVKLAPEPQQLAAPQLK
jgi:hypothetical protein